MPGQNLTRDEAAARSAVLAVQRYEIWLDLTGGLETFRSRTVVSFTSTDVRGASFADLIAPRVAAVSLNGAALEPAQVFTDSRVRLDGLQATNELVVDAECAYMRSDEGLHRFVDPVDDRTYLWSQLEAADARRVFACFEQPDLKASFTLHVTAPADWTVVSNAATPEPVDLSPGDANADAETGLSRRWDFAPTEPMATYLLAVVAGPYHRVTDTYTGAAARIPLGWLCRQSLARHLDADELFAFTKQGLAHYEHRFATPYGFTSYDQVFVPEYSGAMEHPGCVTFTEQFVFRSRESESAHAVRAIVLLHEMAHMWFGDIVTMRWWDDLWLNEAFANWACYWAMTAATEFTDAWAGFLASDKLRAYAVDRGPTSHPIRQSAPDVAVATAGFDAITYVKGSSVLKQLVAYVGEDAFVAGLRAYFEQHAWGNAALEDLMRALESASGRDLTEWTRGWLDTAGADTLVLEAVDGTGFVLRASGPDGGAPRPHRLGIGVYDRADGALARREVLALEVSGPSTDVPDVDGAALVLVNDDDHAYAVVRPDAASVAQLLDSAADLPTATARAVAVSTAWDLLMAGELPAADFVRCANAVLAVESADSLVEPFLQLSVQAAEQWTPDSARDELLGSIAQTCLVIAEHGGNRRMVALRALALAAGTQEELAVLRAAAADDVDLGWRALTRFAALGRLEPGEVEALREKDPDPDAWVRALAVDAAQPSTERKEAAWRALVDEHTVPMGSTFEVASAFWQPSQADALAPFAERYIDALPRLGLAGMISAMSIGSSMFPLVGVSPDYVDRVVSAAEGPGVSPVVARGVLVRADQLRRMLSARGVTG